MDSWEKIEQEMRATKVGRGQVGYDTATQADRAFEHFADRLRALRERDEKRREIVRATEKAMRQWASLPYGADFDSATISRNAAGFTEAMADRLRAAREGRDA